MMVNISSNFDSGNIVCIDSSDHSNIQLEIRSDGKADFFQWFFFRVDGGASKALSMNILNVHKASYVEGWKNYRAVASYDLENWFRVDTAFNGKTLTISHTPDADTIYYAYFAPYPSSRYRKFIDDVKTSSNLDHAVLGQTLDGQDIDYFACGNGERQFWVIARQHPGETMGSWWVEGYLSALAKDQLSAAVELQQKARVHVVPCMNLDGAKRGHLRTNAAGVDLNRAWRNTSMDKSPEVFLVREKMRKTGVEFFLDVHGDEAIPNNFLDGANGISGWNEVHQRRFDLYSSTLLDLSKDFQTKDGYPNPAPGKANLDIATNYVADTWDCLAMTLEMPFKDANVNPDPVYEWSPARCQNFAREHLQVMARIVDSLS